MTGELMVRQTSIMLRYLLCLSPRAAGQDDGTSLRQEPVQAISFLSGAMH